MTDEQKGVEILGGKKIKGVKVDPRQQHGVKIIDRNTKTDPPKVITGQDNAPTS